MDICMKSQDDSNEHQGKTTHPHCSCTSVAGSVVQRQQWITPSPKLKLLDQAREILRLKHYSIRTKSACCDWIRRYIQFHKMSKRDDLNECEGKIELFLAIWPSTKKSRPRHPPRFAGFVISDCRSEVGDSNSRFPLSCISSIALCNPSVSLKADGRPGQKRQRTVISRTLARGKEALELRIVVCADRRIVAAQSVSVIRVNSRFA
jgi:hypothetical protein